MCDNVESSECGCPNRSIKGPDIDPSVVIVIGRCSIQIKLVFLKVPSHDQGHLLFYLVKSVSPKSFPPPTHFLGKSQFCASNPCVGPQNISNSLCGQRTLGLIIISVRSVAIKFIAGLMWGRSNKYRT